VMHIAGQGALPFTLVDVQPERFFADETPFGPMTQCFEHRLESVPNGGTLLTHRVLITGPGAEELGPNVVEDIPRSMASLVALAEQPSRV
jgi:hypothetical protein